MIEVIKHRGRWKSVDRKTNEYLRVYSSYEEAMIAEGLSKPAPKSLWQAVPETEEIEDAKSEETEDSTKVVREAKTSTYKPKTVRLSKGDGKKKI